MKTFLKYAVIPIIVVIAVFVFPHIAALLINQHSDIGLAILLGLVSIIFAAICTFLKGE